MSADGAAPIVGSGAKLTQRVLEANANLTVKERAWLAEQEKVKGNECFRCVFTQNTHTKTDRHLNTQRDRSIAYLGWLSVSGLPY